MPLVRLDKVSLNFGTHILLDEVDFTLKKGTKIGLLGRNGAGKTTFMKVIAGSMQPDSGERWLRPGVEVAWLEQSLPEADEQSVYDMVAGGLAEVGELLKRYHHLITDYENTDMSELERVQGQLEAKQGWSLGQKVDTVITQLQLPANKLMSELSGGWRKRVALARALVREPEFLLLDEPTNHLDVPAIEWLEKQLQDYNGAVLLVTHDRTFLQNVVNKIVEIDRGHLYEFEGTFQKFLDFREQQLASEDKANKLSDKKLAQEEVWIRQGIKARRTRNEGRVRALEALRRERSERRELQGRAKFKLNNTENSGKIVAELEGISHSFDGRTVIKDFSTTVMRGDRIGIVGANGAGKSTLLKILLGKLTAQEGTVKLGSKLQIAYFDQLREHLDMEKNLIDNVSGGQDYIEINGQSKHVISYLGDFLFVPDRIRTPAKALSGGEQNRAILAKVFSRPANILVLDEPTNDLDIETLELLEDILLKFDGTVLLVSHDRQFMDNVVTSITVFEGDGKIGEYVGGYSDWSRKGGKLFSFEGSEKASGAEKPAKSVEKIPEPKKVSTKKLSYKDQRELDALPATIEELEKQQAELEQLMSKPEFYDNTDDGGKFVEKTLKQAADLQTQLDQVYERWEELEKLRNS
ncbi:MAG: ATP-binding cassette domain-containing protein [Gammaproteobacteria bacterium]|nr:ATP-binding cassette domain-containing protein [Gammaproteobacteria bacterium]MDG2337946.1 ATP-binding cassette domain-containing protein [Gammaproteobacteria bacterium]